MTQEIYSTITHVKDCNNYSICNWDPSLYEYKVHDNVTISGTPCYSTMNGNLQEQVIDANTEIIHNDTEVNSESLFRIVPCENNNFFDFVRTINPPQQWLDEYNPR